MSTKIQTFSDNDLLNLIRKSSSNLDVLYRQHKDYCLNFMYKINQEHEFNLDIYHDAVITFYEKICTTDFNLTCSIQTYLNSICRNQLLSKHKKSKLHISLNEEYDENIKDWIEDDSREISENKLNATVTSLEKLKALGGNCYEILKRFYYDNHSMSKIAEDLNYTNADNVKNQKARCQKRLTEEAIKLFNSIND
jgi:RNA polymerase sigma factor (sigma-70 family)